ncbi:MAG: UDP-N-acetylmuramoyl-L-alanine--D-glutamate ligase, partial [Selenomonas sp.]|nr:UDP-N-acetylmuramoyl-L-alanine--D-glutamate ligase [Selenomonas sp.]
MDLTGKKVLIIGAGVSGFAAAKITRRLGAQVTLSDTKNEADLDYDFEELRDMGIKLVFGPQSEELLDGVSLVVVSPAVPARIPLIQEAYKRHIRVASEVELGYQLKKAPICAVTGTNGKTTTVTLLGLLLETHFNKVGVGGNIGVPLSEVALTIPADGCIAAEISSYQMEVTEEFRPHVATVLNVTPDHIVRHGSMEEYQRMKERMFAQQKSKDFLVLNYDDERVKDMANRASAHVVFFSRQVHL